MKKLAIIISCFSIFLAANAYASIKVGAIPEQPYNGEDYVGEIVAAYYPTQNYNITQDILILTVTDGKNGSNLKGLTLKISEKDLPFGLTLANSVGKKIAVLFTDSKYDINAVYIVTDKFWYGEDKKMIR